jgi:hypothetical protein
MTFVRSVERLLALIGVFGFAALMISGLALAGPNSCGAVVDERSLHRDASVKMTIVNASSRPLNIYWVDEDGMRRIQGTLAAGETRGYSTYATHPWLATEADGICRCAQIVAIDNTWTIDDKTCRVETAAATFEPTADYERTDVQGWKVYISSRLAARPDQLDDVLAILDRKLAQMRQLLPADAVAALRPVKIWLELSDPRFTNGVYHSSLAWLKAAAMNPDKVQSVQFSALLASESAEQPAMILHEFGHAFGDLVLGKGHPAVAGMYERACKLGLYRDVERHGKRPAYALNNRDEFFAELSESYFLENDYYPYDRDDMADYDPVSTELIGLLWHGKIRTRAIDGAPTETCDEMERH